MLPRIYLVIPEKRAVIEGITKEPAKIGPAKLDPAVFLKAHLLEIRAIVSAFIFDIYIMAVNERDRNIFPSGVCRKPKNWLFGGIWLWATFCKALGIFSKSFLVCAKKLNSEGYAGIID
jgi:hypothetical protein